MVITGTPSRSPRAMSAGQAHHLAVVGHDLADRRHRGEPGELQQVDGGLGVAVALAHAAVHRAQRQDVAGPGQAASASRSGRRAPAACGRGRLALMPVLSRSAASTLTV